MDIEQEIVFSIEDVPVTSDWQFDEKELPFDCIITGGFVKFAPNCQNKLRVCPRIGGSLQGSDPIPDFGDESNQWLEGDGDFITFTAFRKAGQGSKIIMAYWNVDADGDTRTLYAHVHLIRSIIAKVEKLTFMEWLELFPKVLKSWLS